MSNYFAPTFKVKVNDAPLKDDVSIESISVTSMPDTLDTFTFTIANTLPEMRWTHDPSDATLFREGNSVSIAMGYVGNTKNIIDAEITTISPTFPADGIPTLTIGGHTRMHRLRGTNKTKTFQNMTDGQIAQQIAQANKLEAQVEDTQTHYEYVMQPNQSDLEFLKQRATRIDFEILVEGTKLIFRRRSGQPQIYTLVWAGVQRAFASSGKTLPLKSFSPQIDALAPQSNIEVRGYDVATKQAFVSHAGPSDQTSTMGGSQAGANLPQAAFKMPRTQIHVTSPVHSQEEGDQRARAALNSKAMETVKGTAETIGIPDLRAGHLVELLGLGPRFSGQYKIDQATHSIGAGGYSMSLNVTRNSIS
jgi:phage protein D